MLNVEHKNKKSKRLRAIGFAAGIPLIMGLSPITGYFIGKGFDYIFSTAPWGKLLFLFIGLAAGFREAIVIIKKMNKEN